MKIERNIPKWNKKVNNNNKKNGMIKCFLILFKNKCVMELNNV